MSELVFHRIAALCLSLLLFSAFGKEFRSADVPAPGFQIQGIVIDGISGAPLSQARVSIALADQNQMLRSAIASEGGKFVFEDLASGKYKLIAARHGYLAQAFDEHEGHFSLVVVGDGVATPEINFRLFPESSISGLVTDDHGEALRKAAVLLFQKSSAIYGAVNTHFWKETKTDDRGIYYFRHLRPGKYYVAVSAVPWYARHPDFSTVANLAASAAGGSKPPPQAGPATEAAGGGPLDVAYPITFYPNVTEAAAASMISLERGTDERADVRLHAIPSLHLQIRTANPNQAQRDHVVLEQTIFDHHVSMPVVSRQTAPGFVQVAGFPAGHYMVTTHSLEQQQIISETQEADIFRNGELSTINGQSSGVLTVIIHQAGPPVQGTLTLRNKRTGETMQEDILGRSKFQFRQRFAPGEYDIALRSFSGSFIRNITVNDTALAGKTLRLRTSAPVNLAIAIEQGDARIEGIAVRANAPAAGIMMVLVPQNPENNPGLFRREQTNTDGSFAFTKVPPGRYTVLAIADRWNMEWANPEALKPYAAGAEQVQVEPGKRNTSPLKVNVQ